MRNELITNPLLVDSPTSDAVADSIYRQLRESIIQVKLSPGQALSEAEVAKTYGTSRQPVREAFIRLGREGLVKAQRQRGTFVVKISVKAVNDARFIREALEVAIARELAQKATAADISNLRDIVNRQSRLDREDNAQFLYLDDAFHRGMAMLADREAAWQTIETVKAQIDRVRYLSFKGASPVESLIDQHGRIVDAIEAHDPDMAERIIKQHLNEILQTLPIIAGWFQGLFED